MNILLYYQNHYHTVFLESLCQGFVKRGHQVFMLTTCSRGQLHSEMEKLGVKTFTYEPQVGKLGTYFRHFFYLIKFCKQHQIDAVYSHLQFANLIAVLAQGRIKAKVIPCRHHSTDVEISGNRNAKRIDRWVNKFAKQIVVVSNAVKNQMITYEGVPSDKIHVINLGYNFDLYHKPDPKIVAEIKKQLNCEFILIMISRMNSSKRHMLAAQMLFELIQKGLNVKMIMMDEGTEKENVLSYLKSKQIEDQVLFTGFINNTMDHLAAADLLIHPSISEASNQVVKEAGLVSVPSIVCKGVGDFDEYIVNAKNGFLVDKENAASEMAHVIGDYYHKKNELRSIGARMHDEVVKRFAIDPVCEKYIELARK
jgi:glycosyltransferase involved in cell wall biosynthesis